jgi:hypothetical protein
MPRLLPFLLLFSVSLGCSDDPLAPTIARILPEAAKSGTDVDIIGERFSGDVVSVAFGGIAGRIVFRQQGRLRVTVPKVRAGQLMVVVTVDGRRSNAAVFTQTDGSSADGSAD